MLTAFSSALSTTLGNESNVLSARVNLAGLLVTAVVAIVRSVMSGIDTTESAHQLPFEQPWSWLKGQVLGLLLLALSSFPLETSVLLEMRPEVYTDAQ